MTVPGKRSGPLAAGSAAEGFLYSPPASGKPRDPTARRFSRWFAFALLGAYAAVGLAVGIPAGLATGSFLVGYIAGFGAAMVFGVVAILVAVFHESRKGVARTS